MVLIDLECFEYFLWYYDLKPYGDAAPLRSNAIKIGTSLIIPPPCLRDLCSTSLLPLNDSR